MDLINFVTHQNKSFGNYSILCQAEALRPYNLLDGSTALWYHHAT